MCVSVWLAVIIIELKTISTMNDPTINSPLGVRPEYDSFQCDDVMPRVGTDSEGRGLTA